MNLLILAPGKIREPWQREGIAEYVKRLSRFMQVEIRELPDAPDSLGAAAVMAREAEAMLPKIPERACVIALDLAGKALSSDALAPFLEKAFQRGGSQVCVLIGGSHGLDARLLARSDFRLKLSELTFTHGMARLLLLEQVYRAMKLLRGEPYGK